MNLPFFLSRRLYGSDAGGQKVSRPAIHIATIGVAVGVAVMVITMSVVIGFKTTIRDKVVGFAGSIQVANYMTLQTSESYPIVVTDSLLSVLRAIPGVHHAQRFAQTQGLLKTDDDFLGVTLTGVAQEWDSTFIHRHLLAGALPPFSAESASNMLVLSQTIAQKLLLHAGDRVYAYFFDGAGVRLRRFTVAAIYETNLSQYDDVTCLTDLYTTCRLNGWDSDQALGAEVYVDDYSQLDLVAARVAAHVDGTHDGDGNRYATATITQLAPQIFAWLDLLDMNVWIILVLMILVASVTMIAGLMIIILERTAMIGTLKALGARTATIQRTFLWLGLFIVGRGLLLGDALAIALLAAQHFLHIVRLDPQSYYVSYVPVACNIPSFVVLNGATLLLCLLVLLLPSILIAHIRPAKAMRFE